VKNYDLFDLAVRNVRNSRLRNFLTTVGIAVGVASLVAMLSLGIGLQNLATKRLKKSGIFETIFVTSRSDFRNADRQQDEEKPEDSPLLDEKARHDIEKLPNVAEVVPEIRAMGEIEYDGKTHASFVAGLPPSTKDDESLSTLKGTFFSSPTANEVILQQDFAKRLDPNPSNLIGKNLKVRYAERRTSVDGPANSGFSITRTERDFRIVGILEEEPFGGMRNVSRARVFFPTATAEQMNLMQMADTQQMMRAGAQERVYTMLTVRVQNSSKADQVQDAIKKMKFGTYSFLDATKNIRRFFAILDGFLGIFGSLALAVASLAIVNTLVMAVLERRREIGIMKALGASDIDIRKIFFAEAAAMGAAGGVLGVLLGWGIGRIINTGTNFWLASNKLPAENFWFVPWWLVLSAIVFAILVSIVSGLYPASRAAKLDPVQALRYE
jgi:putative ABC transport system permease protein